VFHLPSQEALKTLYALVVDKTKQTHRSNSDLRSATSGVLVDMAESIDKGNHALTQGLFVIGDVICLINPITGVAAIGSALMPSVVADLVSSTSKRLGNTLKVRSESEREEQSKKLAAKALEKTTPTIMINTVLAKMDKARYDVNYEPNTDFEDTAEIVALTSPLIKALFLARRQRTFFTGSSLPDNAQRYFEVLDASTPPGK